MEMMTVMMEMVMRVDVGEAHDGEGLAQQRRNRTSSRPPSPAGASPDTKETPEHTGSTPGAAPRAG
ncbi:hypothetical protein Dda_0710 [Drechslerella dactyloides]|uniref:Uncharacterized protein n=1 Tax=Drechslerella dactyloides TaxID=74499 RepID=A0AAD6NPA0_DREDA|nr:hypothetical protein Dda_0710 [Drechslerella dactyloides]